MKSLILLAIALATSVQAQQQPCLKLSKVEIDGHVLHVNGDVAKVQLVFEGEHCYVFSGAPGQARQSPEFDIQSLRNLDIEVGTPSAERFDQTTVAAGILRAQEISVTLNVAALPGLNSGEYRLPGQVHYQVMDGLGNVSDETLAFEVPLKVAGPKKNATAGAIERPGPAFSDKHPIWAKVLLPLEIIALFPLWILAGLISGESC